MIGTPRPRLDTDALDGVLPLFGTNASLEPLVTEANPPPPAQDEAPTVVGWPSGEVLSAGLRVERPSWTEASLSGREPLAESTRRARAVGTFALAGAALLLCGLMLTAPDRSWDRPPPPQPGAPGAGAPRVTWLTTHAARFSPARVIAPLPRAAAPAAHGANAPDSTERRVPATFAVGQAAPRIDRAALERLAADLRGCAGALELVGHTCALGGAEVNRELGAARARKVSRLLAGVGLNARAMLVRSAGSSVPVASNDDDLGREANRRVTVRCVNEVQSAQHDPTREADPWQRQSPQQ